MEKITVADVISRAEGLSQQGQINEAITVYSDWLNSPAADPQVKHAALFNIGVLLRSAGRMNESIAAYQQALALKPNFYQAAVNLGLALEASGHPQEAIKAWESSLQPVDGQTLLLNHIGRVFESAKAYAEAENHYRRSLVLAPDQPKVIHHYLHLRQKQCKWPIVQAFADVGEEALLEYCSPMSVMALTDDPAIQFKSIKSWALRTLPQDLPRLSPAEGYRHDKLRIGYFSCDFRWHAVSILTAEIFELHDRGQFEIYGIDYTPDDGGTMRQRVLAAMDHHLPIHSLSDEAAAQLIREHEIDILIDLTGLTAGARPGILCYKPAPVQISYLGFVGTSGIAAVDYVLADRFVFPDELAQHFVEKPLYLPEVYQSNDSQRLIADTPSRAACSLPDNAFVYCSFNGSYKITPEVFTIWMNILKRVPDSVLWLVADNEWAQRNLEQQAIARGVDCRRLIFAGRVPPTEYLARFRVADLMLDTSPYNAGTTASDALWADLPILTCPGRTFASRMAGSLLNAVGLPELIVGDWQAYEDLAVELAKQPERLRVMRQHLRETSRESALFDSKRFVANLEKALKSVSVDPRKKSPEKDKRKITLEIVSATRLSEAEFWEKSALGLSLKRLKAETRIKSHIFYENSYGLSEVYNRRIQADADADILVFIHDDIWIDDYYLVDRLIEGLAVYDVVGVAGNRRRAANQPSWAYVRDGKGLRLDDRMNFSGFAANGKQPFAEIDFYGEAPAECLLLDGLFLAAYKYKLLNYGLLFDPRFDFHFYDMDFCRTATGLGLKLGTWQICLTHQSVGELGNASWMNNMARYFEKWGN